MFERDCAVTAMSQASSCTRLTTSRGLSSPADLATATNYHQSFNKGHAEADPAVLRVCQPVLSTQGQRTSRAGAYEKLFHIRQGSDGRSGFWARAGGSSPWMKPWTTGCSTGRSRTRMVSSAAGSFTRTSAKLSQTATVTRNPRRRMHKLP